MTTICLGILSATIAFANPNPGTYQTADLGGQMLTGRASTSRPTINSGNPKILHAQSWNGSTLGTQWELRCAVETTSVPPNTSGFNPTTGTGTIIYTQTFNGGEFELFDTGGTWGHGVASLGTTTVISSVSLVNFVPVASTANANTSGTFPEGCVLQFALANGYGVGETTSSDPQITKPADYPSFLASDCSPADGDHQFGTWGAVITGTMNIGCATPATSLTWGAVKSIYR